jgi:outer membrane protein OmpA-like peptidoglycan-associated protein
MKTDKLLILVACGGFLATCATVPQELVNARAAYEHARTGPTAQVAPAELHKAKLALDQAERSYQAHQDSYQTRDLAYVAQRKAQVAETIAAMIGDQKSLAQAKADYLTVQGKIVAKTKSELTATRADLMASKHGSDLQSERLATEQEARTLAELRAAEATAAKTAAEHNVDITAVRLLDEQKARLTAEQQTAAAQTALAKLAAVKEDPRGMVITLSGSVLFASNQAILLPEARTRLNQVAEVLLTNRERNLTVEGYTDSRGTANSNIELSQRRADAVRTYLVQRGYEADRIVSHGLGEDSPIADNNSVEGRANNRRVEIIIENSTYTSGL